MTVFELGKRTSIIDQYGRPTMTHGVQTLAFVIIIGVKYLPRLHDEIVARGHKLLWAGDVVRYSHTRIIACNLLARIKRDIVDRVVLHYWTCDSPATLVKSLGTRSGRLLTARCLASVTMRRCHMY